MKGWEYLDAEQQSFTVDTKGRRTPKVTRIKLHQVYNEASWSLLSVLLGV